ncbi:MAG: hypothetical protein H6724_17095 [Sandaracinus sp.]|nr:hypothetical protein [Sandaracinus sp.]
MTSATSRTLEAGAPSREGSFESVAAHAPTRGAHASNHELATLEDGTRVVLTRPEVPGVDEYVVLHLDPPDDAPSSEVLERLVGQAHALARTLSFARFGHADGWSLLINGGATRRTRGIHVHVVLAGSVKEKRRAFLALQAKLLTRPIARWWKALGASTSPAKT